MAISRKLGATLRKLPWCMMLSPVLRIASLTAISVGVVAILWESYWTESTMDLHSSYWPATRSWLVERHPWYTAWALYNPPWVVFFLAPFAALPQLEGKAALAGFSLAVILWATAYFSESGTRRLLAVCLSGRRGPFSRFSGTDRCSSAARRGARRVVHVWSSVRATIDQPGTLAGFRFPAFAVREATGSPPRERVVCYAFDIATLLAFWARGPRTLDPASAAMADARVALGS